MFTRYEAAARATIRSGARSCCGSRPNAGLIASRDPRGVPIFERYFVGGIYDVRGFPPRSLGPRIRAPSRPATPDSALRNFLVGGNMQVICNTEIEFPLFEKVGIRGVVFIDIGQRVQPRGSVLQAPAVQRRRQQGPLQRARSTSRALRHELGLRLPLVLAHRPAALRVGHPVQDRCPGEEPLVFEFTIGNFF